MQRELADAKAQHILRHRTMEFQCAMCKTILCDLQLFLHDIMILYRDLTYSILQIRDQYVYVSINQSCGNYMYVSILDYHVGKTMVFLGLKFIDSCALVCPELVQSWKCAAARST